MFNVVVVIDVIKEYWVSLSRWVVDFCLYFLYKWVFCLLVFILRIISLCVCYFIFNDNYEILLFSFLVVFGIFSYGLLMF